MSSGCFPQYVCLKSTTFIPSSRKNQVIALDSLFWCRLLWKALLFNPKTIDLSKGLSSSKNRSHDRHGLFAAQEGPPWQLEGQSCHASVKGSSLRSKLLNYFQKSKLEARKVSLVVSFRVFIERDTLRSICARICLFKKNYSPMAFAR